MSDPPSLQVEIQVSAGAPLFDAARLANLLAFAAAAEEAAGEVGVWVADDGEIAELHRRFMGLSGPTDVMSFPGDEEYLGDIAVSFDTAARQAVDARHSVQREIAYLCLHGFLHLVGYDDLTPVERDRMISRQDALLAAFEEQAPGDWA